MTRATVITCDHCGTEVETRYLERSVVIGLTGAAVLTAADLCGTCRAEFVDVVLPYFSERSVELLRGIAR